MHPLTRLLVGLRQESKTTRELAECAGVSESRMARLLKGYGVLSVANCIGLAVNCGADPLMVLRSAGHEDVAAALEGLWGQRRTAPLTSAERTLLERWRRLPAPARATVLEITERLDRALDPHEPRGWSPRRSARKLAISH